MRAEAQRETVFKKNLRVREGIEKTFRRLCVNICERFYENIGKGKIFAGGIEGDGSVISRR